MCYSLHYVQRQLFRVKIQIRIRMELLWRDCKVYFFFQWLYSPFLGPGLIFQCLNLFYTDCRTPWTSDQPVARPLPIHRTTQTQNKRTHKHPCLSMIRTYDPGVRASEDSSCLRPLGYRDRLCKVYRLVIIKGDVIHTYLGCNICTSEKHFMGIAPPIKENARKKCICNCFCLLH
jgi:hypothetical protein